MPLKEGSSRETKAHNYAKLRAEGYPRKQAIAIMLDKAGQSRKKKRKTFAQMRGER